MELSKKWKAIAGLPLTEAETKIFESNQEFPIKIRKSGEGKNYTYELFGNSSSVKARMELTGGVNSSHFEQQLVDLIAKFFKDQK